jgi:bifunctional DNA-binding transcriptional regulator/antitoxin component of YhaV-PrlF toxin-antitoxin module
MTDPITLSPKYQVVIPERLRQLHDFKPGMQFVFVDDGASIRMVPIRGMKSLRGTLKGILKDSDPGRDEEDRPL